MQQHMMQMQPMIGAAYASNAITTDHIQKYLDENRQLILAILDNQNLGKLNECAQYQARLQQNLMYLAAIADSQPPAAASHAQIPSNAMMQASGHYMQHQQSMTPQSLLAARSSMLYAQQPINALHQAQQQQSLHNSLGMNSGGNNGLQMLHGETNMGNNGPLSGGGFADFGRGCDMLQASRGLGIDRGSSKIDGVGSDNHHSIDGRGSNVGQSNDEGAPSYLKSADDEGN